MVVQYQTDFSSIQNQSEIDIYTHANEVVLNSICRWLLKVTGRNKKPLEKALKGRKNSLKKPLKGNIKSVRASAVPFSPLIRESFRIG